MTSQELQVGWILSMQFTQAHWSNTIASYYIHNYRFVILSCFESCQGEGLEYWQKDTWQFSGKAEEKVLWNFLLSTPGWFVVDQTLFDHWRDSKFTCCMVGEACSRFLGLTVSPWISFNVKNGGKTNGLELKEEVHDWPMYLIRKKHLHV